MKRLDLSQIEPSMVLAEPVHDFQGNLLLDKGKTLSEKEIWMLKSWGVAEIRVEGGPEESIEPHDVAEYRPSEVIEKHVKTQFSQVSENPVMAEIMRVAEKMRQQRHQKDMENGNARSQ
jgi:hypothetical protein